MQKSVVFQKLDNAADIKTLIDLIKKIYDEFDLIYTTTNPNGVLSARRGKQAILYTGGKFYLTTNVDGATSWKKTEIS